MVRRLASAWPALLIVACTCTIGSADEPGKRVYEAKCSRCHGGDGRGGGIGPSLVPFQWSDERALKLVREPECDMPPMDASEVSDVEVAQIATYLRTLKRNSLG